MRCEGFTFVELLFVMAIIGVVTAISLPLYQYYRTISYDSLAEADLRKGILSQEAVFSDQGQYQSCTNAACEATLSTFRISPGVDIRFQAVGVGDEFQAYASHKSGSVTWDYNSTMGVITRAP